MSREWKPGDVALVRLSTRAKEEFAIFDGDVWTVRRGLTAEPVDEPRPVVVIDPEDREQVERLWQAWRDLAPDHFLAQDNMQDALRILIADPKPAEPMGLGAVVEDADGDLWFRMAIKNHTWAGEVWQRQHGSTGRWSTWDTVAAVRVLSEGVTQ